MTLDGNKILHLIKKKGFSVRQFAEISGVHRNTLHEIVNNRKGVVQSDTVEKIAKALDIDPNELWLGR